MNDELTNDRSQNSGNDPALTLFRISDILVQGQSSLSNRFEQIYSILNQWLDLPEFAILIRQPVSGDLSLAFHVSEFHLPSNPKEIPRLLTVCTQKAFEAREPIICDETDFSKEDTEPASPLPKAIVAIPMFFGENANGTLIVQHFSDPEHFNRPGICNTLKTISNLLCIAIEKKHHRKKLETFENYLFNIINSMPSILIVVDENIRVTRWNLQAELETGIVEKDALGRLLEDVFPRLSLYMEQIKESVEFNRIKTRLRQNYTEGEETRFEDIIIYPLTTDQDRGVVIRMDDITDQVRLEEMMIQSEKMLSIGGLAAGMAHEINNPLAGMMQNAQVIYNRLSNNVPANETAAGELGINMESIRTYAENRQIFEKLDLINETGTRAAEIIRNMLSFARKSDITFRQHDICKLLVKTLELLKNDYNLKKLYNFDKVEVIKEFETNMPQVMCDRSKLQQVFFNLLKNGAEAMFDAENKNRQPRFIFKIYTEGKMACIELENNGPPINISNQKRLFEPFFTTKPVGKGTGLGLSLSYFIIVKDHKGEMLVETTAEEHTRFTIKIPF